MTTPRHLFVYGTLRPGEPRWPYLAPFVADEGWADAVEGRLFDTGRGYPAAAFGPQGDGALVRGQVLSLLEASQSQALEVLDRIEGAVIGLYRREVVTTVSGTSAWAYRHGEGMDLIPIPSGDWLAR